MRAHHGLPSQRPGAVAWSHRARREVSHAAHLGLVVHHLTALLEVEFLLQFVPLSLGGAHGLPVRG